MGRPSDEVASTAHPLLPLMAGVRDCFSSSHSLGN